MAKKNPFEHLVEQLSSLFEFVEKNKEGAKSNTKEIPKWVNQALDDIEKDIKVFQDLSKQVEEENKKNEHILKTLQGRPVPELSDRDKRAFDRADKIRKQIQELKREIGPKKTLSLLGKGKAKGKSFGERRKAKFQRLGGKKGWEPL
jgi:cysteinyl-tRNA synthetase